MVIGQMSARVRDPGEIAIAVVNERIRAAVAGISTDHVAGNVRGYAARADVVIGVKRQAGSVPGPLRQPQAPAIAETVMRAQLQADGFEPEDSADVPSVNP
jgi:hypothetical protein